MISKKNILTLITHETIKFYVKVISAKQPIKDGNHFSLPRPNKPPSLLPLFTFTIPPVTSLSLSF